MVTKRLSYSDLVAKNIVKNRPSLKRLIENNGFPPGKMTGPNSRTWAEDEVQSYIDGCPTKGPQLRGAAKARRDRARSKATAADNPIPDTSEI
jgi:predicted DNA-binding transcriptional regulator AlpA